VITGTEHYPFVGGTYRPFRHSFEIYKSQRHIPENQPIYGTEFNRPFAQASHPRRCPQRIREKV